MKRRSTRCGGRGIITPLALLCCVGAGGCAGPGAARQAGGPPATLLFVPGAGGDGAGYAGLRRALAGAGGAGPRVFGWGAPAALFFLNFQDRALHAAAETKLAGTIAAGRREADGLPRIFLVGHSAGCGVILGALGRLPEGAGVEGVVLLSPSVSPGYNLAEPLRHVRGRVHVFYSDRDTFFLKWRTGTFGTYDNVKTPAAGYRGFTAPDRLPADLRAKVVQHPYDPRWKSLGNDGGHFGSAAGAFVREQVRPLLGTEQNRTE